MHFAQLFAIYFNLQGKCVPQIKPIFPTPIPITPATLPERVQCSCYPVLNNRRPPPFSVSVH